ncbi:hypothetical protein TUM20249_61950 [Pseudomonas tohonis]|jgi:hypothetical protein|nr:hypothetical protein TUM20249_61950 [Pseudomonas tohonis]
MKPPQDLAARKMRYHSEKCPVSRSNGSGGRYEIDGTKAIEVEPQDIYETKLAIDGTRAGMSQKKRELRSFFLSGWLCKI